MHKQKNSKVFSGAEKSTALTGKRKKKKKKREGGSLGKTPPSRKGVETRKDFVASGEEGNQFTILGVGKKGFSSEKEKGKNFALC